MLSVNRWVIRSRWNLGSESVVRSTGSLFQSLGANRAKSLGRVGRCPAVFSEGSLSIPMLADLSARRGLQGLKPQTIARLKVIFFCFNC